MRKGLPKTKAGWEKFCQKLANDTGMKVSVGYEEQRVDIASAEPQKAKDAS